MGRPLKYNALRVRKDADGVEEKCCRTCGEFWPNDAEFFYKDCRNSDGLRGTCKACEEERVRAVRARRSGGAKGKRAARLRIPD